MAHIEKKLFSNVTVWNVALHSYTDVKLELHYQVDGTKHTTYVTHEVLMPLCEMKFLGGEFQRLADELLEQWQDMKNEISGIQS